MRTNKYFLYLNHIISPKPKLCMIEELLQAHPREKIIRIFKVTDRNVRKKRFTIFALSHIDNVHDAMIMVQKRNDEYMLSKGNTDVLYGMVIPDVKGETIRVPRQANGAGIPDPETLERIKIAQEH